MSNDQQEIKEAHPEDEKRGVYFVERKRAENVCFFLFSSWCSDLSSKEKIEREDNAQSERLETWVAKTNLALQSIDFVQQWTWLQIKLKENDEQRIQSFSSWLAHLDCIFVTLFCFDVSFGLQAD